MLRHAAIALVFAVLVGSTPVVGSPPERLSVGGQSLLLAGRGTREKLFIDLYAVGLYLPRDTADASAIRRAELPKALRVEVLYDGSLPDEIPAEWRNELLPALGPEQQDTLRRRYAQLGPGDHVTIQYAPEVGTTVAIDGEPILRDPGHALMGAFLDLWIGRTPVSEALKRSLLS